VTNNPEEEKIYLKNWLQDKPCDQPVVCTALVRIGAAAKSHDDLYDAIFVLMKVVHAPASRFLLRLLAFVCDAIASCQSQTQ
jgi:hypothetical protein